MFASVFDFLLTLTGGGANDNAFYFVRVILKITGNVAPVSYVPYRFPAESIVSPPAVVFCENLYTTISLPAAVTSHNKLLRRFPEANPKTFPDESTTT